MGEFAHNVATFGFSVVAVVQVQWSVRATGSRLGLPACPWLLPGR